MSDNFYSFNLIVPKKIAMSDNELEIFSKKYGVEPPNDYRFFAKNFKLGRESLRKEDYLNERGIRVPLLDIYFGEFPNTNYIQISEFIEISQLVKHTDDNGNNYVLIAQSNDPGRGGILLGLSEDTFGKIFKYRWEQLNEADNLEPMLIAASLFDFILGLKARLMWQNLNTTDVYKNWGEDFWRVREKE